MADLTKQQNTGHGHVFPRPDGVKARCGGPAMCSECAKDKASLDMAWGIEAQSSKEETYRRALMRIAKWFGEFPETGRIWEDGSPMSYGACWGSNGERDFMRNVATEALAKAQHEPSAPETRTKSAWERATDVYQSLPAQTKTSFALHGLYWDQVDYLTRNKLGGMQNHWMRAAREALGMDIDDVSSSPEETSVDPLPSETSATTSRGARSTEDLGRSESSPTSQDGCMCHEVTNAYGGVDQIWCGKHWSERNGRSR